MGEMVYALYEFRRSPSSQSPTQTSVLHTLLYPRQRFLRVYICNFQFPTSVSCWCVRHLMTELPCRNQPWSTGRYVEALHENDAAGPSADIYRFWSPKTFLCGCLAPRDRPALSEPT